LHPAKRRWAKTARIFHNSEDLPSDSRARSGIICTTEIRLWRCRLAERIRRRQECVAVCSIRHWHSCPAKTGCSSFATRDGSMHGHDAPPGPSGGREGQIVACFLLESWASSGVFPGQYCPSCGTALQFETTLWKHSLRACTHSPPRHAPDPFLCAPAG
jgi:hypothetical protein